MLEGFSNFDTHYWIEGSLPAKTELFDNRITRFELDGFEIRLLPSDPFNLLENFKYLLHIGLPVVSLLVYPHFEYRDPRILPFANDVILKLVASNTRPNPRFRGNFITAQNINYICENTCRPMTIVTIPALA